MKRQGFTLIELLVSMTVTIFIMLLLTQAFGTGIETFQTLQSAAHIQGDLRTVGALLKSDLEQSHFEAARKLSDSTFWKAPVREGFFVVRQGSAYTPLGAGTDQLNVSSTLNHVLHFSSRLKGNRRDSFYQTPLSSAIPGAQTNICKLPDDTLQSNARLPTIGSQWAEIAYFVGPSTATSGKMALYRSQLIVFGDNAFATSAPTGTNATAFSTISSAPWYCTPKDLARGTRSLDSSQLTSGPAAAIARSSLVIDNLLSFQVQVLRQAVDPTGIPGAIDADFQDVSLFDSSTGFGVGTFVIKAVKVTVRAYDPLKEQTRQITTIHEL